MKKTLLTYLFTAICLSSAFAQKEPEKIELSCYNKWALKFEDRGAEEVKDGVYTDVIVTSRQGSKSVCNSGKAEVVKGKVTKFYILLSDGTYELVNRTWKNKSDENVLIINGMSKAMITVHNEILNVLWPSSIKAKRAKPIAAPDPDDY